MKVMIVVLVGIAVAVVLLLFFGAVRPQGNAGDAQGGIEGGFGWLVPRPSLDFDDVSTAPCANATVPGFVVPVGGECSVPVPDPSQITLCIAEGIPVKIETFGTEYPVQTVKADSLRCGDPKPIAIYDTNSVLRITCEQIATCIVAIVPDS